MKEIELLSEHIDDEIHDAGVYARLALEWRERDPETAAVFAKLSGEESGHMDALHRAVVRIIERYRAEHGEPPEGMRAVWDYLHRKEIERAGEVRALQDLWREA